MYTYFNKIIKIRNKKYQQFFMKDLTNHPMHVIINTDMQIVLYGTWFYISGN